MEAGRELDALVAEKVMEFRRIDISLNDEQKPLVPLDWADSLVRDTHWWGKDVNYLVPHYSTRIQDAWLVVEKLVDDGFCPALIFDDDGQWALANDGVQNIRKEGDLLYTTFFIDGKLFADTAPLAICLAALKAVEVT